MCSSEICCHFLDKVENYDTVALVSSYFDNGGVFPDGKPTFTAKYDPAKYCCALINNNFYYFTLEFSQFGQSHSFPDGA